MAELKYNNLQRVLQRYTEYFKQQAQGILSLNGSIHTGNLFSTIGNELSISIEDEWLSVKVSLADYWEYVDKGTRPHWTSVNNLKDWAEYRGLNPYAVQWSIAQKGTSAHPFFDEAKAKTEQYYEEIISEALEADFGEWVEAILNEKTKNL